VTTLQQNQFHATCPKCGKEIVAITFVDRSYCWFFFRTVFKCAKDNWALMTRIEPFNAIESDVGQNPKEVPNSIHARVRLDLNKLIIGKLISGGLESYPLSKVVKFSNKWGEAFYEKTLTERPIDDLHVFYHELAIKYGALGEIEMKDHALSAAADYLI
jgi:hypothetical protein